jgi:hypothetical protein
VEDAPYVELEQDFEVHVAEAASGRPRDFLPPRRVLDRGRAAGEVVFLAAGSWRHRVQGEAAIAKEVLVLGRQVHYEDVEAAGGEQGHHRMDAGAAILADGGEEGDAIAGRGEEALAVAGEAGCGGAEVVPGGHIKRSFSRLWGAL